MVFTTNVETKIGFDKIRQLLVKNCLSPLGTKKVDTITVSTNYEWILEQLNQTNEFVKILVNEEDFPIDSYFDIHESLSKIATEGTFIEVQELFKLRCSLHTIGLIVTFFNQKEECDFFYLKNLSKEIDTFPAIVKSIDHILDNFIIIFFSLSPKIFMSFCVSV